MRYIGSKLKVLKFLEYCIGNVIPNVKGKVFADLMCGTTAVSRHFKNLGCKIISNDYMAFSYALQIALIKLNNEPKFLNLKKLNIESYYKAIEYLNDVTPCQGFFYDNYCLEGTINKKFQRNYFSQENAQKIDAILEILKDWKIKEYINFDEDKLLRACLIDAVTKISNISGTYGAFLKKDDKRKFNKLRIEPLSIINSNQKHECYNKNIFDLIDRIEGDILYLDPPYNSRQYPPYYHILETISLDDKPKIYGKTGRRPYKDKMSLFCLKNKACESLNEIIKKSKIKNVFVSYNSDGIISQNELKNILSSYGEIRMFKMNHQRYKSNSNGEAKTKLNEIMYYVRKN